MKTFFEYIVEDSETRPVRLRLLPAIKHPSGKIHTGKRGEDHSEIREKHMDENGPLKGEAGFYDPKERAFMSRDEAAKHAPRAGASGESTEFLTHAERGERSERIQKRDSTDDMSDMQRMRKYGTFEEETDLEEGNQLYSKVEKPLSQGEKLGTVSYERGGQSSGIKKTRRKSMEADLEKLRQRGSIKGYKKATGRYLYKEPKEGETPESSAPERSYIVRQGEGKKARHFDKIMRALGKRYDQESIGKIEKDRKASFEYTTGPDKGKVDSAGKVNYNTKIGASVKGKTVMGDTRLRKGKAFSFTEE